MFVISKFFQSFRDAYVFAIMTFGITFTAALFLLVRSNYLGWSSYEYTEIFMHALILAIIATLLNVPIYRLFIHFMIGPIVDWKSRAALSLLFIVAVVAGTGMSIFDNYLPNLPPLN